jgi:hemin uptake protein HemP
MRQPFCFTILIILWLPLMAAAESTITYQGQLQQDGQPFTGTPEMEFRLFDSLTGTNQIGDTEIVEAVPVNEGLFQVELNFGAGVFDGTERWLEIEVAGNILEPRQRITGAPWSHQALSVVAGSIGSDQIAPGAVGPDELLTDSLTIASGTGLQGGGDVALGGSTTIGIADGGVGGMQIATGAIGADQTDSDQIQLRITGSCGPGTTLAGVNSDGSVACAALPFGLIYEADSDGDVGYHTSIAIRDDGHPIISYGYREHEFSSETELRVFDCDNTACSAGTVRSLDSIGSSVPHSSVAIRDNGHPIISYMADTGLKAFDCSNTACSEGTARALDSDETLGDNTSIAIRDDGHPIISYRDHGNGNLKAYDCSNTTCSEGTARIIDDNTNVGYANSIAIRDDGHPIISYRDHINSSLKIFDCENTACSDGAAHTLDTDIGWYTSIAVRDDGTPIISYQGPGTSNVSAFDCGNAACSEGTARALDDNDDVVGQHMSLAIRDDGNPIISYFDSTNGNLKTFDCDNAACSSGTARTLDNEGTVGRWTSIAIRDDGNPIISYQEQDFENGLQTNNLKVFSCGDPHCAR